MKQFYIYSLLILIIITGCKKDRKDPINPTPNPNNNSLIDFLPSNRGQILNLSRDGLKMVVWDPYNDTIHVYNTFDGSLQSEIVHPNHFASGFERVVLTDDGTKVISQQDNYEIKLWDAVTGGFIRDLEIVHEWYALPDGSGILGFEDNLSWKHGMKVVDFVTGTTVVYDTLNEMLYPYIAGSNEAGTIITLVEYIIDSNDPFNPLQRAHIVIRDIHNHTYLADYETSQFSFPGTIRTTDNNDFYCMMSYDSIQSTGIMAFYDNNTGLLYSDEPCHTSFNNSRMIDQGPGNDRFVYISDDWYEIDQIVFSPSSVTWAGKYSVTDSTHYGFRNVDVSRGHTRVAASYGSTDGKKHIAVWPAY